MNLVSPLLRQLLGVKRAVASDDKILAKTIARYGRVDRICIDELRYLCHTRQDAAARQSESDRTAQISHPGEWRHRRATPPARATNMQKSSSGMPFPGVTGGRTMGSGSEGKEWAMKAKVGDWLVIKGTTVERPDQRGVITDVRSADGSPPYIVRWLTTGHVATVLPGTDAVVVTSAEQKAADKRARSRSASVETAIAHDIKSE
jgi:hypothetical protein